MIIRAIAFTVVFLSSIFLPIWVFLLFSFAYGFVYAPYELLMIGLLIDSQFGDATQNLSYIYTASIVALSIIIIFVKPQLRICKN